MSKRPPSGGSKSPTPSGPSAANSSASLKRKQSSVSGAQSKKKLPSVADVPLDGIDPIDETAIDVPTLTEARMYGLNDAVDKCLTSASGEVRRERFVRDAAPPPLRTQMSSRGSLSTPPQSRAQTPSTASAPASPTRRPPRIPASGPMANLPPRDELMLKLAAYYKRIHGGGLRVHEELARNLRTNIADIVYVEDQLASRLPQIAAIAETTGLPPVCFLLLHMFTCDEADLEGLFGGGSGVGSGAVTVGELNSGNAPSERVNSGGAGSTVSPEVLKMRLIKQLNLLRQAKFADADDAKNAFTKDLYAEVTRGLQYREPLVLARWIGVASVVMATFTALAASRSSLLVPQCSTSDASPATAPIAPAAGGRAPKGGAPQPVTSVKAPDPIDAAPADCAGPTIPLFFRITFPSTQDALRAVAEMAASEQPVNLPILQPMSTRPPPAPAVVRLKRPDGFVEPNYELAEDGSPRSFADKVRLLCAEWIHPDDVAPVAAQPAVPTSPSGSRPPSAPGQDGGKGQKKKNDATPKGGSLVPPQPVTDSSPPVAAVPAVVNSVTVLFRVIARADAVVSTRAFSRYPVDAECVIINFPACTVSFVDAEKLVVELRQLPDTDDALAVQTSQFFEAVIADARKASITAKRITTRLVQQFVRPHHCHRHPTQPYSHFCQVCRVFICAACTKEIHLPHAMTPIAAFCVDESVRLNPKKRIILQRLECLRKLRDGIAVERAKMVNLVNDGVGAVLARLQERRRELHVDVDCRAAEQVAELQREKKNVEVDADRIANAKAVVAETKKGHVGVVPRFKLHERWQVNDKLVLKLPTEHMKKLVRLLTWSNPSKYLTHLVYPPEEELRQAKRGAGHNAVKLLR